MRWHQKEVNNVIEDFKSSHSGLTSDEARKRLEEYGLNELTVKKKKTAFMMFLDQFKDFMIIVLICAAAIAGIVGKPTDAIAIIAIVILAVVKPF